MSMYSFLDWLYSKQNKLGNKELDPEINNDNWELGYLYALNEVEHQLEKNGLIYQDGGQL